MTYSPNFTNAGRRVLAVAVVASMSVPLSISAAIAAPDQANISAIDETAQKAGRETSTVDLATPPQGATPELKADATLPTEEAKQKPAPEVANTTQDKQQPSGETSVEVPQVEAAPIIEQPTVEQPPQPPTPTKQQSTQRPTSSTEQVSQEEAQNASVAAARELRYESAEPQDRGEQPVTAHHEGDDSDEGKAPDAGEEPVGDDSDEGDAEEESGDTPGFAPNGPSLDVRDVAPETDYTIRVGDNERTYTTGPEGSAAINVIEDFELPPGAHKIAIIGPDGQEQEITFYATEMQADNTKINVIGLDPSATYQLSLDGRITHVGVFDFTPLPDGTFTLDINKQFPQAWPGKHAVTLTGGGYNQTIYLRIPLIPPSPGPDPAPNPNPNPDPEPVPTPNPNPNPNPNPETGPDPVPGANPDPRPNPSPDLVPNPNPEPQPGVGENLFPAPRPPQPEVDEPADSDNEDDVTPSAIESLDVLQAAEAVKANRPPAYEAAELPLAAGDQERHAAPEVSRGTNRHEPRLEAAPMPHAPVPLDEGRNETQVPRHESIEQDNHQANPSDGDSTAQGAGNLDTERTAMSGLSIAAWIGAALALLAAFGFVLFGRKRKTE